MAGQNGGARPGAGRKPKAQSNELKDLFDLNWTQEERAQTIRVISAKARSGDVGMAKLLFAYAYGMPIQRQEVSGPNGGPLEIVGYSILPPAQAATEEDAPTGPAGIGAGDEPAD